MQQIRTKVLLLAVPLFLSSLSIMAQGWEKSFGSVLNDGLYDVVNTPDGGFLSVGHKQISGSPLHYNLFLVKTDAGGFIDWSKEVTDTSYSYFGKSIQSTDDGGYIIGGTAVTENIPRGFMAKTDGLGNCEWVINTPEDSIYGVRALELSDGTFMLAGSSFKPGVNGSDRDFYQMRVSANGTNVLQTNTYGGSQYDDCRDMVETPQGDLVMAGFTNSFGAGHYDVYLIKINIAGDTLWTQTYGMSDAELAYAIAATNDGNLVVTGQTETFAQGSEDVFLKKINQQGGVIWEKTYPKDGLDLAYDVQPAGSGGGFIMTGYSQKSQQSDRQVFLLKTYANGDEHWIRHFGGVNHDVGFGVKPVPTFGFVVAGFTNSYSQGGSDGYLIRTDVSGITHSCLIMGNVHTNENNTCNPLEFGENVGNILIEVAGATTYFGTTDEDGNYSVPVKEGNYNVRLINPSPYWALCEDSISVFLSGSFDTVEVDFSMNPDTLCSYMRVDLTTLNLRRCFQNTYTVNYCNLGTLPAQPAEVEVTFDPYLVVDSASIPWVSHVGQTYLFEVGYIDPFECGSFRVFVTVDCDSTVLGQTHCSEARIFPDEFCFDPDPNWDQASVELNALCDGDSIHFFIQNVGVGNMAGPLEYIVIEDHIVGLQGDFQLNSGYDTTIVLPANGATWRLEAEQSNGHPGISKPSIAVEGCGGANFNTGFVIQYPLNDADPFIDTDCRENIGSYDPNDKNGYPKGYGEYHFIEKNTDIEYLIRFQNTGTDTAFTVVIRDTLSAFLDPSTIEVGAGSHAFRYELYGSGILKFVFDNIMLPDSNVNEAASHGFVKFRIKQKRNLPAGTIIRNRAAIYFDFNEPIITNTTTHTIGENFIEIDLPNSSDEISTLPPQVHVYPNPFLEEAWFELENISGNEFEFQLLDRNGQLVIRQHFRGNLFQFKRENLSSGLYFFRIMQAGRDLSGGKVFLR